MPLSQFKKLCDTLGRAQHNLSAHKKKIAHKFFIQILLLTIFCLISIRFFDQPLAFFINHLQQTTHKILLFNSLYVAITNIIYFLTLLAMVIYALAHFFNIKNRFVEPCGMLALVLALSFFIKTQLQLLFGRASPCAYHCDTPTLLTKSGFIDFYPLTGGCFPSGHMIIFTSVILIVSFYYPKITRLCYGLLLFLALLLLINNYHYLSDIIAGAYLGYILALTLKFIFKPRFGSQEHNKKG